MWLHFKKLSTTGLHVLSSQGHRTQQGVHLSFKNKSPVGLVGLPDPIAHRIAQYLPYHYIHDNVSCNLK